MYETYCDVCRNKIEENSEEELRFETYDLCKDCRKKVKDYINQLKNREILSNNQKGGIKNMQNIKQIKVKVHRDDFVDGEGRFHTRIEIVTSPLNIQQAIKQINLVPPGPRVIMRRQNLQPQAQQMQQIQQQNFQPMNIGAIMKMGKEFLDASGVDLKEVFKELTHVEPIEIESDEDVEEEDDEFLEDEEFLPVPTSEEEPTEDEENTAKAYLKNMLVPETKPEKKTSKNKKEVKNKKWKKTQKTKQNQRKKLQQKK